MTQQSAEINNKFIARYGAYIRFFVISWLYMLVVYFSMYANRLVNHWDGIWEYSYYKAGKWSISCGRWLWPYLDRLRLGISVEPITTMFTCALFALGFTVAVYFLAGAVESLRRFYVAAFLLLGSASVCISLSYRYMSPTYGFAFLFAILATGMLSRNGFLSWPKKAAGILEIIICGFLIAAQMGLYQAYLGCTGVFAIVLLLDRLSDEDMAFKDIMTLIGRFAASLALGGVLYVVGLKIHLTFAHVALDSYKGADSYGLINTLKSLGSSIVRAYSECWNFFFGFTHRYAIFMNTKPLYIVLMVLVMIALAAGLLALVLKVFKQDAKKGIAAAVLALLIPLGCNIVLLIATSADYSLQMTVALAFCIPAIICLIRKHTAESESTPIKVFGYARAFVFVLLLYGVVMQTEVDQEAMRVGMESVTNMAEQMVTDIKDEGLLSADKPLCVIGVPAASELYYMSRACEGANHYAVFGAWGTWSGDKSWRGVFHNLLNLNVEMAEYPEYGYILSSDDFKDMPCYPSEGYIKEIDGVVAVKASDVY